MNNSGTNNCTWPGNDPLMQQYHDEEWGIPVHDDRKWFEFIVLDAFQAGLSWKTILHRRENFRRAFDNFVPDIIAGYDETKILSLMQDPGIIRNQAKIRSTVSNARAFLRIQSEFGSFDKYIWQFTEGKTIFNNYSNNAEIPARNEISDAMSNDLIKREFKFAGSVICYSFMQAAGMVNDHLQTCSCRNK
jgi:DNA-3-methyladenine glycosylase I